MCWDLSFSVFLKENFFRCSDLVLSNFLGGSKKICSFDHERHGFTVAISEESHLFLKVQVCSVDLFDVCNTIV